MINLVLPLGHNFGWGVCGKYLAKEIAGLSPVKLITPPFDLNTIGDEFDYFFFKQISVDQAAFLQDLKGELPEPVIQAITDDNLLPMEPAVKGKVNIGYTFFENSVLSPQSIENAQRNFDVVAAGSSWCENILREHGLKNTRSILQGVDRSIFNACENQKTVFNDKFVVFSGGKLEFRKGQDLVIRAFKALQDKYDDILLVNAWFNPWEPSLQTMATSPYIDFTLESRDYLKAIEKLLSANGIDVGKVITLPPKANVAMARIYKNSDCGLFPNRCEGGTNLVLMEYMACGKPAIVSNSSGQRDVANKHNAIMLNRMKKVTVSRDEEVVAVWDDPDLDEMIDKLEWAYHNREALLAVGEAAGRSMERFTWESAANKFYQLTNGI
jgi:glycosyltransferase involved in cell wall biosynthesis